MLYPTELQGRKGTLRRGVFKYTTTFEFALNVPCGFLEILRGIIILEISPPNVLHRIAQVEAHVFHNVDALNTRWVAVVMDRVVNRRISFSCDWHVVKLVGMTGFEPATSWPQTKRSTRLSYIPF